MSINRAPVADLLVRVGEAFERQKHYNVQQAIYFTGLPVDFLSGWAADHVVGTVKEGVTEAPSSGAADDHRFGYSGRGYDPSLELTRFFPINLREALPHKIHCSQRDLRPYCEFSANFRDLPISEEISNNKLTPTATQVLQSRCKLLRPRKSKTPLTH